MTKQICWCGCDQLSKFSPEYSKCSDCHTLISLAVLDLQYKDVKREMEDFYNEHYWVIYQTQKHGNPNIHRRARLDLPERCVHWLKTLLKYKLPPAKTLELGCAHGGFVALQSLLGYEAQGLELAPWVVDFARKTFGIDVLQGPIEQQGLGKNNYDALMLMDVLEHLPRPAETMQICLELLKPEGVLIIQTPCFPEGLSYEQMVAGAHPFLEQLKPAEHLYLFTERGIKKFFAALEAEFVFFEPAIFSHYDMFLVVSRHPFIQNTDEEIEACLASTSNGRVIQALIDLKENHDHLSRALEESQQKLGKLNRLIKYRGLKGLRFRLGSIYRKILHRNT